MSDISRREFLATASAATFSATALSAAPPADKVTVGLIGTGGMGGNHLKLLAGNSQIRLKYLCDCDANRLTAAAKSVEGQVSPAPVTVTDMREIFDDPQVDAVWIATPDHWHTPAALLAVAAGKHVYVEKPVSHNIREGRLLTDAARKARRVVQVGTQSRSTPFIAQAIQRLKDGAIGDVLVAKAWNSQKRSSIGHSHATEPPPHLDFELWLGPAPPHPYRPNMVPAMWRFWREFGVGDIGNDGVHDIDVARWGLGVMMHPSTVAALGHKMFFDDDQQFPDTYYCVFDYPGDGAPGHRKQLIYEQRDWSPYVQEGYENGAAFYGTNGLMLLGHTRGYKVYGPRNKLMEEVNGSVDLPAHHQNFLDCIRTGARPNADVEEGHLSATLCHLGNIACRVSRVLNFDSASETIRNDKEANDQVRRTYREGHWAVPAGV